ncbi:MAG: F0F1 ATP synthase subunit A [Candidatus Saccharimonadales bacterium]
MNLGYYASALQVFIAPGGVFKIGGLTITNAIFYGWICTIAIVVFLILVARRVTVRPKGGVIQLVEAGVEFIMNTVEGAFEDKEAAQKYVPFFVTLFFFILLNNELELLPIVGTSITSGSQPLLRPMTADLNATFAMALITMIMVYVSSVKESGGIKKYFRHFFVGSPKNPLYFLIGVLEMITDSTRVISLSLRLFLNVTIGEILIAVFAYLGHIIAPVSALPFTLIEVFIDALQAYIFTILGTMYLAIAVNMAKDHNQEHLTEGELPETMSPSARGKKTIKQVNKVRSTV